MQRTLVAGNSAPGRKRKAPGELKNKEIMPRTLVVKNSDPGRKRKAPGELKKETMPRVVGTSDLGRKRKAPVAASTTAASGGNSEPSSAGNTSTIQKRVRKASTSVAAAGPVSPPPARATKGISTRKEPQEKRLSRYVYFPTRATSDRITRAYQQRLYLIDKRLVGTNPNAPSTCVFNVLGSTGNVYEVKLQQKRFCTCPDFPRSGLCKHILFVMLRVLKLDRNDPKVWQKALLTSELRELLEISATSNGEFASQTVRQRFQEIQRVSCDAPAKAIQREITGDCPVCYEKMDDGKGKAKEPVIFCRVCGNNVHRDCFERWSRTKSSSGGKSTCIYCRALWMEEEEEVPKTRNVFSLSDYVNLANVS